MYWTDVTEKDGLLIVRLWCDDVLECEWSGTEEQLTDLIGEENAESI